MSLPALVDDEDEDPHDCHEWRSQQAHERDRLSGAATVVHLTASMSSMSKSCRMCFVAVKPILSSLPTNGDAEAICRSDEAKEKHDLAVGMCHSTVKYYLGID